MVPDSNGGISESKWRPTLGDFRGTGAVLMNPFDPATWDGDDASDDPLAPLLRR